MATMQWVGAALFGFWAIVVMAHHPAGFLGLFLFFIGFAQAYPKYQDERLLLREGLLVAFFLAGLVVLGGQQQWWRAYHDRECPQPRRFCYVAGEL